MRSLRSLSSLALVLGLVAAACTAAGDVESIQPEASMTSAETSSAETSSPELQSTTTLDSRIRTIDGEIVAASLVDQTSLNLVFRRGTCVDWEAWLEETEDEVVVGVRLSELARNTESETLKPIAPCGGGGFEESVEISLAAPLGRRSLVLTLNELPYDPSPLCFSVDGAPACGPITLRAWGNDQTVSAAITGGPVDLEVGPEAATFPFGEGSVEISSSHTFIDPLIAYEASIRGPEDGIVGRVLIHNYERDLSKAEPYPGLVDGRVAVLVGPDDENYPDGAGTVVVIAGGWSIDIWVDSASIADPKPVEKEFLEKLSITETAGGIPRVTDGTGWLNVDSSTLHIGDNYYGFTLYPFTDCDPEIEPRCLPGIGLVQPSQVRGLPIEGAVPDPSDVTFDLSPPPGLEINTTN